MQARYLSFLLHLYKHAAPAIEFSRVKQDSLTRLRFVLVFEDWVCWFVWAS